MSPKANAGTRVSTAANKEKPHRQVWGDSGPDPRSPPAERYLGRPLCTPRSCLRQVPRMSHSLRPAGGSLALTCQGPATLQKHTRPGPAADFSVCQTEVLLQNKSTPTAHGAEKHGKQARRKCQRGDGFLVSVRTSARCMSGAEGQGQELDVAVPCKSHRVGASEDGRRASQVCQVSPGI